MPEENLKRVGPPASAADALPLAGPGLRARALAGLPPTSILLLVVAGLLLVAGVLSFAAPEFFPSQRRILVLLGAVLLTGGALREPGRVRYGLWPLAGLTSLTWLARHPLDAWWFGGLCLTLGASAVPFALLHGGWRPGRSEARAGLHAVRGAFGLLLLVALAGAFAAACEFFDLLSYGAEIDVPADSGTPGPGYGNLVEQALGAIQLVGWLLLELVLAAVTLGCSAGATALLLGFGGTTLALEQLQPAPVGPPELGPDPPQS